MSNDLFEAFIHVSFKLEASPTKVKQSPSNAAQQSLYGKKKPIQSFAQTYTPAIFFEFSNSEFKPPHNIGSFCFPEKTRYPSPDYHPKFDISFVSFYLS